jgi:hypothetical protein
MLLLPVWFDVLDVDNYFVLAAFQMAWLTLYVAWHDVLSASDYDVHM